DVGRARSDPPGLNDLRTDSANELNTNLPRTCRGIVMSASAETSAAVAEARQSLIKLEDLKKVFYAEEIETHALSGVHFDMAKGDYVSIEGPSGCGKSTWLS